MKEQKVGVAGLQPNTFFHASITAKKDYFPFRNLDL